MSDRVRVTPLYEVAKKLRNSDDEMVLQYCRYNYGTGCTSELLFRFIRRGPNGNLKAQRGQAGIPDLKTVKELTDKLIFAYPFLGENKK